MMENESSMFFQEDDDVPMGYMKLGITSKLHGEVFYLGPASIGLKTIKKLVKLLSHIESKQPESKNEISR